ncbi:MAG: transglutaminase [Candidatus Marinimicrobia bacterium]|nr:transglutaminase [Candidatus Neomarinimicrobiota bacterium]
MKKLFFFILFLPFLIFPYTGEVAKSFNTPGPCSTGLTFDGKNIWVADRKLGKIFCISPENGKILKEIKAPGNWPMGLAWDGKYLWNADPKARKIFKIDPKDGTIVRIVDAPTPSPRGLAWDGKYLWCTDNALDKVMQISPYDGTTIIEYKSPAGDPRGITYDGKYLWISDRITDEIYMMDTASGSVIIITDAPGPFTRGLAFDEKYLWAVDYQNDKIYKLKVRDGEKYLLENEREANITLTHRIRNYGPGRILKADVHIALPLDRVSQKVLNTEYIVPPTDFVTDQWGQKTAHYTYKNIKPGEIAESVVKFHAKVYGVKYFVYPDEIGTVRDIPKDIKKKYLQDSDKYQINHPAIKKAVKEAIGDETNAYWIARKIYNYILKHMYYELSGGWNTAPTVLTRGNGSCSEYSFVFISMCRSAGIPAKYVGSVVVRGDDASIDDVFHRWVEIYLPGYGWLPVDPSGGDKPSPRDQARCFGSLSNRFLITTDSGGNSKTLGWYYNTNEFIITQPDTKYEVETFAEWEPIKQR